ncbi:chorismate lyase [Catenovulum agarivorans DS-2]|uniref:Probable chorismate pyruvate-lyase n=1 Tax=Catenovulum agarivorans DS-2 TaxID=1328313 RepID=W7QB06_9ALTE|nr:chorismate lyase [Catenovulum agarivorans]EWH10039.1 chorismate lyase [Catenovulum agarivorans DS-2]
MQYCFPLGDKTSWQQQVKCAENIQSWLADPSSLTAKLKSISHDFSLTLLGQGWQQQQSEASAYLAREVLLNCQGQAWVYAHTHIPQSSLVGDNAFLSHLENKPLGEAIFQQKNLVRAAIEFGQFDSRTPVWQMAEHWCGRQLGVMPPLLYGRRSRFVVNQQPIFVSEIFLPDSPLYL